jgi:hypothetical protein
VIQIGAADPLIVIAVYFGAPGHPEPAAYQDHSDLMSWWRRWVRVINQRQVNRVDALSQKRPYIAVPAMITTRWGASTGLIRLYTRFWGRSRSTNSVWSWRKLPRRYTNAR